MKVSSCLNWWALYFIKGNINVRAYLTVVSCLKTFSIKQSINIPLCIPFSNKAICALQIHNSIFIVSSRCYLAARGSPIFDFFITTLLHILILSWGGSFTLATFILKLTVSQTSSIVIFAFFKSWHTCWSHQVSQVVASISLGGGEFTYLAFLSSFL